MLRFVPHDRMPDALEESAWVPEFEPGAGSRLLAPARRALRAALLRHRPAARQHVGRPASGQPDPEPRGARAPGDVRGAGRPGDVQRPAARAPRRPGPDGRDAALRSSSAGQLAELDLSLREAAQAIAKGLRTEHMWIRCFPSGDVGQVEQSAAYPPDDREPAASSCSSRACWPAAPGSSAGRCVINQGNAFRARRGPHRRPARAGPGAGPRLRRAAA